MTTRATILQLCHFNFNLGGDFRLRLIPTDQLLGVALTFPYGAFAIIPIFNMTSVQIFATGALAFNAYAMFIAPMFGLQMEPIEYK